MVRPTRPKEIKPKAEVKSIESAGGNLDGTKIIVINAVTTVLICLLFVGASYLIQDKLLSSKLSNISAPSEDGEAAEEEEGDGEEEVESGLILDLGEFILNLSDPAAKRYLKINVAIELTKLETDLVAESGGGGGHGGGHGESAPDPMKAIEAEMSQFKPAVRDSIISTLSTKTAEELSTVAGKELAKEQIKESVNAIFQGKREVLRVSFGDFIIQ